MLQKKNLITLCIICFVMLVLPRIFVSIDNHLGMFSVLIDFFIINPILSIYIGYYSGKNIKIARFLPILLPLLYIAGTRFFYDFGNLDFLIYASIYLALGIITMGIIHYFSKDKTKNQKH